MNEVTVADAYAKKLKSLFASPGGSRITDIQRINSRYYVIEALDFPAGGYKVWAGYMLYQFKEGDEPAEPIQTQTRGRARTLTLTPKGLAACRAWDQEGGVTVAKREMTIDVKFEGLVVEDLMVKVVLVIGGKREAVPWLKGQWALEEEASRLGLSLEEAVALANEALRRE